MSQVTKEAKEEIRNRFPKFEEATKAFFAKELAPAKYKGTSGKFGCYGERGANSVMLRLRFSGGAIEKPQMEFLSDVLDRYQIKLAHFTTGEALQLHHLNEEEVLKLYQECFDHGIYCVGAGSDNPRNVTASPLHGVAQGEYFDMTPYIKAAANFIISIIPRLNLPRKYKVSFSSGLDNEGHATFKDLGFVARPDHTFDVYAGGGFGLNGSRFGILIDEGVDPLDISNYILGYARDVYMKYGDYEHRGQNRSRFILNKLGDDAFRTAVREAAAKARAEGHSLVIEEEKPLTKSGADDTVLEDVRIGKQKQEGLYYVEYKPLGGTPDIKTFKALLDALIPMEGTEIRLNADETAYIINLTADEARKVAALTKDDTATTPFEHSVSCIGATVCQQGLRDSHGTFVKLAKMFKDRGIDSHFLPKCHFSGCPSNCTVQQLAPLGLRGASKKVGDKMEPAFNIYAGGNYAIGKGVMGEQIGVITIEHLPDFFLALNQALLDANQSYDEWYPQHKEKLIELVNQFE